jgi:hypothetical protein
MAAGMAGSGRVAGDGWLFVRGWVVGGVGDGGVRFG